MSRGLRHLLADVVADVVAVTLVGFARVFTGVRASWRGAAPQAGPTVYLANHTSHGDFVLLWASLPADLRVRTRPVAAADYWRGSALRQFIGTEVFKALLIDRTPAARPAGGSSAVRAAERSAERSSAAPSGTAAPADDPVAQMAAVLAHGDALIFFPEGTRNTGDEPLLPFKSGLYHLARRCPEARLVPVWIENLRRVLPKGQVLPVPLACSVDFGAPLVLQPDESRADFLARARQAVLALRPDVAAEAPTPTSTPSSTPTPSHPSPDGA